MPLYTHRQTHAHAHTHVLSCLGVHKVSNFYDCFSPSPSICVSCCCSLLRHRLDCHIAWDNDLADGQADSGNSYMHILFLTCRCWRCRCAASHRTVRTWPSVSIVGQGNGLKGCHSFLWRRKSVRAAAPFTSSAAQRFLWAPDVYSTANAFCKCNWQPQQLKQRCSISWGSTIYCSSNNKNLLIVVQVRLLPPNEAKVC